MNIEGRSMIDWKLDLQAEGSSKLIYSFLYEFIYLVIDWYFYVKGFLF